MPNSDLPPSDLQAEFDTLKADEKFCEGCKGGECPKVDKWFKGYRLDKYYFGDWDKSGLWRIFSKKCPHKIRYDCQKNLSELMIKSGLPQLYADKSFADYEVTADNSQAVKLAIWFCSKKPPRSLYLYGGVGIGKTFLATLIGKEFLLNGKEVIFGDVPTLLSKIKQTFNGAGSAEEIIGSYRTCDLLILDDIGAGQLTEWSAGILYQVINDRYNFKKPLIITSNFDFKGLQERLAGKDAFSAARIISRLNEMCFEGFLGTKDRRRKQ